MTRSDPRSTARPVRPRTGRPAAARPRALRRAAAALVALLVLPIAACGAPDAGASGAGEPLVVGTDPTHPPHDFLTADGQLVGWENELVIAMGRVMGRPVEYRRASFDSLLPGLASNRYDLVFANMGISAQRLEVVDMVSAFNSGQAFLTRADRGLALSALDTLCGVSVGVTRGSVQADLAERQTGACVQAGRPPIGIQVFQGGDQIILAVEAGRLDAYWTAQPIAAHYASQSGNRLAVAGEVPGAKSLTGIALPRGSELTEPVRAALQTMIDDGSYLAILTKWNLQSGAVQRAEVNPRPRP